MLIFAHPTDARSIAFSDVPQKARTPQAFVPVIYAFGAGAHGKDTSEKIQGFSHGPRVRIRSEITHAFAARATIEESARDTLTDGHREHGIGFIIAVFNVKTWVELFNPRIFQRQSFYFAGDNRPFHAGCGLHHLAGARMQLRNVLEIVRQPRTKVFRLPDVHHALVFIPKFINAWISRNGSRSRPISAWIRHSGQLPFFA